MTFQSKMASEIYIENIENTLYILFSLYSKFEDNIL